MESASLLRQARTHSGLTQTALADRAGTSQATVSAYEAGSKQPSVATLSRLLAAASWRLTLEPAERPVVRPSRAELDRRGQTLVDVLDFADALPFRPGPTLGFPRLADVERPPR
ncbi:MAG: helix-turn-helix domain-containing protein [Solirubrobacterales bacterium]